jgi:hypothetical protein
VHIELNGKTIDLRGRDIFKCHLAYPSPFYQGSSISCDNKFSFKKCTMSFTRADGAVLGTFEMSHWSLKKIGSINLSEEAVQNDDLVDELVVTALAIYEYAVMQMSVATAAVS